MNHKLTLCIIAGLLMGTQSANAAYYYCGGSPCQQIVTCPSPVCHRAPPRHTYHHTCHHKHYTAVKRSHYSIETYYYVGPATPCGCSSSPCSWCPGTWVRVRGMPEFIYGPYPSRYYDNDYYSDDDMGYDFDTRTGDDVWDY